MNTVRLDANLPKNAELIAEIGTLPTINDTDGIECPTCGGRLWWFDGNMDEEYTDSRFELTERFYCDDCGTFADVTQIYRPVSRRVVLKRDIF